MFGFSQSFFLHFGIGFKSSLCKLIWLLHSPEVFDWRCRPACLFCLFMWHKQSSNLSSARADGLRLQVVEFFFQKKPAEKRKAVDRHCQRSIFKSEPWKTSCTISFQIVVVGVFVTRAELAAGLQVQNRRTIIVQACGCGSARFPDAFVWNFLNALNVPLTGWTSRNPAVPAPKKTKQKITFFLVPEKTQKKINENVHTPEKTGTILPTSSEKNKRHCAGVVWRSGPCGIPASPAAWSAQASQPVFVRRLFRNHFYLPKPIISGVAQADLWQPTAPHKIGTELRGGR